MNRMGRPPKPPADPLAVLKNLQSQKQQAQKSVSQEAQEFRALEDTRNALFQLLAVDFKKELSRHEPNDLKTGADRQLKEAMMEKINTAAISLNHQSLSEGAQVLSTAALNCILLLKEEINKISFQNYTLNKKCEDLEQQILELRHAMKNENPEPRGIENGQSAHPDQD